MRFFRLLLPSVVIVIAASGAYAGAPDIFIISPAPGEVIVGSQAALKVELAPRFTLTDPELYPRHADGQGHLHIWLDTLPRHDDAVSTVLTDTSEYTLKNVAPGLHTIYAEFFRNDHAAYEPRVIGSVEFENTAEVIFPAGGVAAPGVGAPASSSGIFLPAGRSNAILSIALILAALGILWYLLGRKRK